MDEYIQLSTVCNQINTQQNLYKNLKSKFILLWEIEGLASPAQFSSEPAIEIIYKIQTSPKNINSQ